jgi:Na+-transporting methylmalonyl-CoA/oxaloacetate decarboxylase gamma subunit
MLTRYTNMTIKSQSYLFSFGFALTLLGMALTDMWLPMVAGAMILMGLMVESWIRLAHIIPLQTEIRSLKKRLDKLAQKETDQ